MFTECETVVLESRSYSAFHLEGRSAWALAMTGSIMGSVHV